MSPQPPVCPVHPLVCNEVSLLTEAVAAHAAALGLLTSVAPMAPEEVGASANLLLLQSPQWLGACLCAPSGG